MSEAPMPDLDALRALLERATPGPWEPSYGRVFARAHGPEYMAESIAECDSAVATYDARLIAALRNRAPELLAVVDAARRARDELDPVEIVSIVYGQLAAAIDDLDAKMEEVE